MIFSDSLSALLALEKLKGDHPLLIQIKDMLHKIEIDQKEVVFIWVPGHVGIRGNDAADRAAKETLEKVPIDDLMPFSDLKLLTVKYIHQVWQKERNHDILPKPLAKLFTFCNTRKKDTVLNRLHIGQTYWTHFFILRKEVAPVCATCNSVTTVRMY